MFKAYSWRKVLVSFGGIETRCLSCQKQGYYTEGATESALLPPTSLCAVSANSRLFQLSLGHVIQSTRKLSPLKFKAFSISYSRIKRLGRSCLSVERQLEPFEQYTLQKLVLCSAPVLETFNDRDSSSVMEALREGNALNNCSAPITRISLWSLVRDGKRVYHLGERAAEEDLINGLSAQEIHKCIWAIAYTQ